MNFFFFNLSCVVMIEICFFCEKINEYKIEYKVGRWMSMVILMIEVDVIFMFVIIELLFVL